MGEEPFTAEEIGALEAQKSSNSVISSEREYGKDWGWAAKALGQRRVTFTDIEKAVSLAHYRPYFKLACTPNHAGSKGVWFDLGNDLNAPDDGVMGSLAQAMRG